MYRKKLKRKRGELSDDENEKEEQNKEHYDSDPEKYMNNDANEDSEDDTEYYKQEVGEQPEPGLISRKQPSKEKISKYKPFWNKKKAGVKENDTSEKSTNVSANGGMKWKSGKTAGVKGFIPRGRVQRNKQSSGGRNNKKQRLS